MLLYNSLYIYISHVYRCTVYKLKQITYGSSNFPCTASSLAVRVLSSQACWGGGGRAVLVVNRLCQIN